MRRRDLVKERADQEALEYQRLLKMRVGKLRGREKRKVRDSNVNVRGNESTNS